MHPTEKCLMGDRVSRALSGGKKSLWNVRNKSFGLKRGEDGKRGEKKMKNSLFLRADLKQTCPQTIRSRRSYVRVGKVFFVQRRALMAEKKSG